MIVIYRTTLLAACLLLTACQTAPVRLTLANSQHDHPGALATRTCRINLLPVKDSRSNQQTLGVAGNVPVLADDVSQWVYRGLVSGLTQAGHQVVDAAKGQDLQVAIKLAYLRSLPLRLHATVSIDVGMARTGKTRYTQTFRAVGEKNNWANGDGEIMEVLNIALNNAVADMAADIGRACR